MLDVTNIALQVLEGNHISTASGAFACPPSSSSSECVVREEGGKDSVQIESDSKSYGKDGRVQYLLQYAEKCAGFEDYPNDTICADPSVDPVFFSWSCRQNTKSSVSSRHC